MIRYLYAVTLGLVSIAIPLRAANKPHAGTDSKNGVVWTNDDLKRLHSLGLISVVGQIDEETPKSPTPRFAYVKTQDPEWYAEEAVRLRDELERRQAQLGRYSQAIEDARSLETMTGGVNLNGDDIGITPEAALKYFKERVSETQKGA
jgi:hypothetical protein